MPRELAVPPGYAAARFRAMDCDVRVLLPHRHRTRAFAVAHLFADWDRRLSRFRPESELSRLNAGAGRPMQVSRLVAGVLRRALAAAEATGGLFDPTLGRRISALGYAETFAYAGRGDSALAHVPPHAAKTRWRDVSINPAGTVTVPAGVAIDLGGIAKGMAVDRSLAVLRDLGVPSALVSAGGDLAVLGSLPDDRAWPVAVDVPGAEETIQLRRGAMATSSIERRRWRAHGGEQHHLLDPRTGRPATTGVIRAAVAAATCEQAEVAAKTALILGAGRGAAFLEERGLHGLLCTERASRAVGQWPERARTLAVTVSHLAWYTARASGSTALLLLTASMAIGLALSVKLRSPAWPRFLTTELHRFTTLTALAFVGVHTAALYVDSYIGFGVADLVVPFASSYSPLGMALGITASYLLAAVWASSLAQRRIGWRLWRSLHYATFAVYLLAVVHTLAMGEDASTPWGLTMVAGSVPVVGGLTAVRAVAAGTTTPAARPRVEAGQPGRGY